MTSYHYDARNKLIEVEKPGLSASYGYNADGIRTRKTENGLTTHYVVDSNRDCAQVLVEVTNGTPPRSTTLTAMTWSPRPVPEHPLTTSMTAKVPPGHWRMRAAL
ncbi:hypothetical protein [Marinobacter sp. DUT-1]|uniref:hypothetical protein n=1 Tax=Marinobacter sp. DUT-1 TaxID=3412037 RepID=UPI003D184255